MGLLDATQIQTGAFAIAIMVLSATRAFSAPSTQHIDAVLKACVEVVNADNRPYKHFDAYHDDPTIGRFHYNMESDFQGLAFEKYMAERGFPLGGHGCHTLNKAPCDVPNM
jgi:hypothetical protein